MLKSLTPTEPSLRDAPKQEKKCGTCSTPFLTGYPRQAYCSKLCKNRSDDARRSMRRREEAGLNQPHHCQECSISFMRDTRQNIYCSDECQEAYSARVRIRARRTARGVPPSATCPACLTEYEPRSLKQATCGDRACIVEMGQRRKTAPCLSCGQPGQYATRVKDAGYCRTCKPVKRRAPMALATLAQDYPKILELIKARTKTTQDGCWEWQGPKDSTGRYGCCAGAEYLPNGETRARLFNTHRLALECKMGTSLGVHQAHHICANTLCCNPDHLQPVTSAQNMGEMRARKSFEARIAELEAALHALSPEHKLLVGRWSQRQPAGQGQLSGSELKS